MTPGSDVHKAVELVATQQQNLSARTEKSLSGKVNWFDCPAGTANRL